MLLPETKDIQTKLGNYTRTGVLPEIPGIHKGHVKHYRRLVFNIIKNNIFQAFPIAKDVIEEEKFVEMIDEFFSEHKTQTSQLWLLPGEFYEFSFANHWNEKYSMPWLSDLLLFEWIEIKVHTMPNGTIPDFVTSGDILSSSPVINPDHEIIHLSYPIHIFPVAEAGSRKGNYYLLIYRNRESGRVHFMNLSALHVMLINHLAQDRASLENVLPALAKEFKIKNDFQLQTAIRSFVKDLLDQQFVLGFHRKGNEEDF